MRTFRVPRSGESLSRFVAGRNGRRRRTRGCAAASHAPDYRRGRSQSLGRRATATPPALWGDRPAGYYERTGWRIRAAYVRSDLAFEVEYVVCQLCKTGWVEAPHSYEGYKRCGLASAALRSLRHACPGVRWHTASGHFHEAEPFWNAVSVGVPGGYPQQRRCHHTWNHGERDNMAHDA